MLTTANTRGHAQRAPVLMETDVHSVAGCVFNVSGSPSPCVTVRWQAGATQVSINGTPVLTQTSVGLCYNAANAPQGSAVIANTQQKASGI